MSFQSDTMHKADLWDDTWWLPTTLTRVRALADTPGETLQSSARSAFRFFWPRKTQSEPLSLAEITDAVRLPLITNGEEHKLHQAVLLQSAALARAGDWLALANHIQTWDQSRKDFPSGKRYAATASIAALNAIASMDGNDTAATGPEPAAQIPEAAIASLQAAQAANRDNYALAGLLSRAFIHNGWASFGPQPTTPLEANTARGLEACFADAAAMLDDYNPIECNSPFLAETRYKLLPGFVDADRYLIDWFEDWRDLDPYALAPHTLQGYYLLPQWFGTYERLSYEATRAAHPLHDGLEAGAYAAFHFQALDVDPDLLEHIDPMLFLAGLDSLAAQRHSDPILVNMLLAWFCLDIKAPRAGAGSKARSKIYQRLARGRKSFARKHLHAIVPDLWPGGADTAYREIGKIFSSELAAGEVAVVHNAGLRFTDPVKV